MNNNTITTSESKKADPITAFVITLGKQLLQEEVREWLDMDSVAYFCKVHGIKLNGQCLGSAQLETQLSRFFHTKDEFYGPGVNVDGYERPKGWHRVFMIRAYPYSSRQHSTKAHLGELDPGALVTACSD